MSSFTKPGAFGAPGPLPGARTYKQSQSAKMVEEALIAEERLAKLRSEVEQKRKASAPSNGAGVGTGHWRAGQADRGSVRNYAKEVKTREQAKLAQQSHKLLQPRRQSLLELALARATVRTSVSAQSSGRPQASSSSSSEQASAAAEAQLVRPPSSGYMSKDVGAWDVQDTLEWLDMLGLSQHRESFSQNEISGPILLEVGQDDLDYMHITALAHRKQLLRGIDDLKRNGRPTSVVTALGTSKPAPAAAAAVPVAQGQQQSAAKSKPAAEALPAKVQHERCGTELKQQQQQVKGSPKVTRHWSEVQPLSEQVVVPDSSSSSAQSANLADGSYDEAAASSAFTDAVMAWRRGSSSSSGNATGAATATAAAVAEAPDSGMWCNPFATPRSSSADDETTAGTATATAGAAAKARTGSAWLLDGEVDEEAEAAAFKCAVAEWRSGSSSSTSGATTAATGAAAGVAAGSDEPLASARPTTASDRTRAIAEALAQQMDAEHAKQARAFEARRQQLEQELQASSAAATAAAAAAASTTANDDDSVTLHNVSDDVSDDEAAALHTSVDYSQYDANSNRDAAAAVGAASPTLSEANWYSSADCDEQTALYTDNYVDDDSSSEQQQQCTLEFSVVESTLGCSQQWQRSSAAAATAYTVQESDDEED
jgi:SAM domain (Sterile alpha motif)